jgi:hypothetical protein
VRLRALVRHGVKPKAHSAWPWTLDRRGLTGGGAPLLLTLAIFPAVIEGGARSLNTVVHTVDVGHHPVAVGIDPSTDRVYVVNDADDNVSVIDGPATQLPCRSRAHVAH